MLHMRAHIQVCELISELMAASSDQYGIDFEAGVQER
jgi:hypothetical protein